VSLRGACASLLIENLFERDVDGFIDRDEIAAFDRELAAQARMLGCAWPTTDVEGCFASAGDGLDKDLVPAELHVFVRCRASALNATCYATVCG